MTYGIHSATPLAGNQVSMKRSDFEKLMFTGGLPALLANEAPENPATPQPATVVMVPLGMSTCRTREFMTSRMKSWLLSGLRAML